MDLSQAIVPKSDQINADDLISGPITVTIKEVRPGSTEQPVNVDLVEFPGRAYRPSKSMSRVLVAVWGKESSAYSGRRLKLVRNPDITFGREKVGGIEIAAMSHLDKTASIALTATRGKKRLFKVEPLAEPAARDWRAEADSKSGDVTELRALYTEAQTNGADQTTLTYIKEQAQ